jgi:hypothetical protein
VNIEEWDWESEMFISQRILERKLGVLIPFVQCEGEQRLENPQYGGSQAVVPCCDDDFLECGP